MSTPTGTVTFLFTDVEGSTRLWEESPDSMQGSLARHDSIVRRTIEALDGYIFATGGDSFSAAFQSMSDALDAALSAQRLLVAESWQGPQIRVRMALHVGQAEERNGDYFGPTLNRTSRLLATAEGGEVLVSGAVAAVAVDSLPLRAVLVDLGERSLRDLDRSEQTYRLEAPGLHDRSSTRTGDERPVAEGKVFSPSDRRRRSIAVLPFQIMGGDENTRNLADGLVEDIITALSMWRHFPVTARNSSAVYRDRLIDIRQVASELQVRFVVEGSVRSSGKKLRVTAQLIDGDTGTHVWADRYDGEPSDIFEFQDQITVNVVTSIDPAVIAAESQRLATKPPASFDAWDHMVRGRSLIETIHPNEVEEGVSHMERALELDPGMAEAHGWLAMAHFLRGWAGWVDDPDHEYDQGIQRARQALDSEPQNSGAHGAMSSIFLFRGDFERARHSAERALESNPSAWSAHMVVGNVRLYTGDHEGAIRAITRSIELSPFGPFSAIVHASLALAYFLHDDNESAISHARDAVARRGGYVLARGVLAGSLAQAGHIEAARSELDKMLELMPDFTIKSFNQPFQPEQRAKIAEALRLVGLDS
jgi:TolB-like protein/Flp pilus assembly protein TadD